MAGPVTCYGIDERGGHWLQLGPVDSTGLNCSGDLTFSSTTATFTNAGIVYTGGKTSVNNSTLNLPEIDFFLHVLYNDGEIDLTDSTVNGNIYNQFASSLVKTFGNVTLNGGIANAGTVNIAPGGLLRLGASGNGSRFIQVQTLTIGAGARLDIGDNKLILKDAIGSWTGSAYTGVTGVIVSGRNGGNWSGNGIVTSQSFATTSNFTSIGVASASDVRGIPFSSTATSVWAGQTVTGTDTLVMYTYGGDANLDGKINADDYGRIDFAVPLGIAGWSNGDFNYDGKINVDDYGIIDFNVAIQGPPFSTGTMAQLSGVATVPEPAAVVVMLAGAIGVGAGRRRRRRI